MVTRGKASSYDEIAKIPKGFTTFRSIADRRVVSCRVQRNFRLAASGAECGSLTTSGVPATGSNLPRPGLAGGIRLGGAHRTACY